MNYLKLKKTILKNLLVTKMDYYKNPLAIIESADIGEGTKIWAFSKILSGSKIGRNCVIGSFVEIESDANIRDFTQKVSKLKRGHCNGLYKHHRQNLELILQKW